MRGTSNRMFFWSYLFKEYFVQIIKIVDNILKSQTRYYVESVKQVIDTNISKVIDLLTLTIPQNICVLICFWTITKRITCRLRFYVCHRKTEFVYVRSRLNAFRHYCCKFISDGSFICPTSENVKGESHCIDIPVYLCNG